MWEPLRRVPFLGKRSSRSRLRKNHPHGSLARPRPALGGVTRPQQPAIPGPVTPLQPRSHIPDRGRPAARAAGGPRAGQPQPVWRIHVHGGGRRVTQENRAAARVAQARRAAPGPLWPGGAAGRAGWAGGAARWGTSEAGRSPMWARSWGGGVATGWDWGVRALTQGHSLLKLGGVLAGRRDCRYPGRERATELSLCPALRPQTLGWESLRRPQPRTRMRPGGGASLRPALLSRLQPPAKPSSETAANCDSGNSDSTLVPCLLPAVSQVVPRYCFQTRR